MEDEATTKKIEEILQDYTPEQRQAPDKKYGTVEKRIAAVYKENPKKAEKEFLEEVEDQQTVVNKHAAEVPGNSP